MGSHSAVEHVQSFIAKSLPPMTSLAQLVKNPPASIGDTGDTCSIPGLGRSPGGGNGDLLIASYVEAHDIDLSHYRDGYP